MAKQPNPTPAAPATPERVTGRAADKADAKLIAALKLKFAAARLAFLSQFDLGLLLGYLRSKSLKDVLVRDAEGAYLVYVKARKVGLLEHEAEERAMAERIRPESQMGAPIMPEGEKAEALALLAEWKRTPEAAPFLAA
jgi:hypothetical protein